MNQRSYSVYILNNRGGTLYIGVTNDLRRRLEEHRAGKCRFTATYRIGKLVYFEVTDDPYAAVSRERELKGWTRERKLALIRTMNRPLRDLAPAYEIAEPFLFPRTPAQHRRLSP